MVRVGLEHRGEQPLRRSVVDIGDVGERLFCGDHAQTFCLSMACCHPNRPSAWLARVLFSGRLRGLELDALVFCAVVRVPLAPASCEVSRASLTPVFAEYADVPCAFAPRDASSALYSRAIAPCAS